jgi:putative ABC transport system permease protein
MLRLNRISKKYVTGDLEQTALDNVSFNLRDNEFVAILGPSGSGKTTLLNVIGGLDHYDSGDLIINDISTKKYNDRDWDSYRNHTIGFVFQSYNLIPHQSVLGNVELALTISGIPKSERRKMAVNALKNVGLSDQMHKKPNQMSGGQMQRVAIARALVNNPDIILADEPTGALDTETSIQVMDLLKEVAKERLVVLVTHNRELAEKYATRIININDGKIISDSNPYVVDGMVEEQTKKKTVRKARMSFLTALSLSFNNLRTKKARTLLTSFAGSIGIIGIALILSLSNGVNKYISDVQKETMSSYPVTIQSKTTDMSSLFKQGGNLSNEINHGNDAVYLSSGTMGSTLNTITNNLQEFKKYLENTDNGIDKYIGENGIFYSYDTKFDVYSYDSDGVLVNADGSSLNESKTSYTSNISGFMSNSVNGIFSEMLPGQNGEQVGKAIRDNYDLVYGSWPEKYDETVLVLNSNNEISSTVLYELGLISTSDYKEIVNGTDKGKEIQDELKSISYENVCKQELHLVPSCDYYIKRENGTFQNVSDDDIQLKALVTNGLKIKITGIIKLDSSNKSRIISGSIGYTSALTDYLIDYADESNVVKEQKSDKNINVLTGLQFTPADDEEKEKDAVSYISNLNVSDKAKLYKQMVTQSASGNTSASDNMTDEQLASMMDQYLQNPDQKFMLDFYNSYIDSGNYDDNMTLFGEVDKESPSSISIYTDSFESKDKISEYIDEYNSSASDDNKITYVDYVALLTSSVTTIINVITYVLVAFVSVSLIVSSIMIGIITYISVLERTKEIGILRAIGASKRNISQVFNAETLIIGLCSGFMGVVITRLLLIPGNVLIHNIIESTEINASLPITSAVLLVVLSMILTLIAGFIPAKKAAKKDPVTALRTE